MGNSPIAPAQQDFYALLLSTFRFACTLRHSGGGYRVPGCVRIFRPPFAPDPASRAADD